MSDTAGQPGTGFRLAVLALAILVLSALALDRGVYVGSTFRLMGAPIAPGLDYFQKRCRYLYVTGVVEIDAEDGQTPIRLHQPARGYCRMFGTH